MIVRKGQWPILVTNLCYLIPFAVFYASKKNYEFLLYIGVIVFFFVLILITSDRVRYPNGILWGLTLWAVMHMAGGGIPVRGDVLYKLMIVPLSDKYPVFRYDQLVHVVGFGVATLLVHHLLTPLLRPDPEHWTALSIVIVMAGLGVGALNEVVEFTAVVLVPETGVGGYVNTSLDLVADLLGAVLALVYIRLKAARASTSRARDT